MRFPVSGRGVFHVGPPNAPVFAIQVDSGDLINVPRETRHWFELCADRHISAASASLRTRPAGRRTAWTTARTGPETEPRRYHTIALDFELSPTKVLLIRDAVKVLDAARAAGIQTGLCEQPGNPPPPDSLDHAMISDFEQVVLG